MGVRSGLVPQEVRGALVLPLVLRWCAGENAVLLRILRLLLLFLISVFTVLDFDRFTVLLFLKTSLKRWPRSMRGREVMGM